MTHHEMFTSLEKTEMIHHCVIHKNYLSTPSAIKFVPIMKLL